MSELTKRELHLMEVAFLYAAYYAEFHNYNFKSWVDDVIADNGGTVGQFLANEAPDE